MIIGGSVRRSGERLRVTAQLVDGATGCYIWSESVDATVGDMFPAQERVAAAIATRIEPELGERRERGVAQAEREPGRAQPVSAGALSPESADRRRPSQGAGLLRESARRRRASTPPRTAGLSDAYGLLAHYGVFGPAEVWTKAAASAAAAVMLDANSAEAHTSLAHVKSTQDWDWAGAEREFQRAISLDPRYATSHHWYAMSCLSPLGRLDEALDEMLRGAVARSGVVDRRARPRGDSLLSTRFRDRARAVRSHHRAEPAFRARLLDPRRHPGAAEGLRRVGGGVPARRPSVAADAAHARRARPHVRAVGTPKQALEVLRKLEAYAKERYVSPLEFAWIQFALGRDRPGVQLDAEGAARIARST